MTVSPTTWIPSWIPATFLGVNEVCRSEKIGEVHQMGLRVTYPGTRLRGATAAKLKSKFEFAQESSTKRYVVTFVPQKELVQYSKDIYQLAIILEESLEVKRESTRGLLVLVMKEEDRGMLCRFFRPVTVTLSDVVDSNPKPCEDSMMAEPTMEARTWFIA